MVYYCTRSAIVTGGGEVDLEEGKVFFNVGISTTSTEAAGHPPQTPPAEAELSVPRAVERRRRAAAAFISSKGLGATLRRCVCRDAGGVAAAEPT